MKKKIIVLAIASAMSIPAMAMAEVKVYGQVNMAYEKTDNGNSVANTNVGNVADSRSQISSNVSRLGFKGSDALGYGLTGIFQMEGEIKADTGGTGAANLFNRNTFLGVAGGFGTVVLGRHDTPYKMATRDIDVFKDSIADNRSIMGGGLHDARLSDVLAYLTPNWGGFSGAVAMVNGTDNTITPAAAATTETSATSLSAKFEMTSWSVALANQSINKKDNVVAANKSDSNATKLAGTFHTDMFSVGLIYERLSGKAGVAATKTEQNNIYASGKVSFGGAGAVKLGYTKAGDVKVNGATAAGSGATQLALGYDFPLSASTTVFALYTKVTNGTAAGYGLSTAGSTGAMGAVGAAGYAVQNNGDDPSAFAIGMRHSF